jgi:hypothetical protein
MTADPASRYRTLDDADLERHARDLERKLARLEGAATTELSVRLIARYEAMLEEIEREAERRRS